MSLVNWLNIISVYLPCLNKRAHALFDIVHSDVWGSCPVTSKFGYKYFVIFDEI